MRQLFDVDAADFPARRRPHDERLERELKVICPMGFAGYFLIVADFMRWSRDQRIPVGRGAAPARVLWSPMR
ncbi:MAG: hypothetical protein R3F37_00590 [Candidatus Competibacteraceae bacterium]